MNDVEFHVYGSRDQYAQPRAVALTREAAEATCRALAWKSGREHYVIEKSLDGKCAEVFAVTP